jgi:hypothetical protein
MSSMALDTTLFVFFSVFALFFSSVLVISHSTMRGAQLLSQYERTKTEKKNNVKTMKRKQKLRSPKPL